MKTIHIEVNDDLHLEVSYKYYAGGLSNDYDVPPDPEEFDIETIHLVDSKGTSIDVTNHTEDLYGVLAWEKILSEVNNQNNN
jgi:hypothetical protein